ncbi:hypothetical protein [Nautilia lithotrophica]
MRKVVFIFLFALSVFAYTNNQLTKEIVNGIFFMLKADKTLSGIVIENKVKKEIANYKKETKFLWNFAAIRQIIIKKLTGNYGIFTIKAVSLYDESITFDIHVSFEEKEGQVIIKNVKFTTDNIYKAQENNYLKLVYTNVEMLRKIHNITNINKILNNLSALSIYQTDNKYNIYLTFGAKYTTNASLVGENSEEISKKNDLSFNYGIQISKNILKENTNNYFSFGVFGNKYTDVKMYDSNSIHLSFSQNFYKDKFTLKDQITLTHNFLDGKEFSSIVGFGVGVDYYWDFNKWTEVTYNYSRNVYYNDVDSAENKNGYTHYFSLAQKLKRKSLIIDDYTTYLSAKIKYTRDLTNGENYDSKSVGLVLSVHQMLPKNYFVSAIYSYNRIKFDNIDEDINTNRKDIQNSMDLILNKKYSAKMSYYLSLSYLNNNSNDNTNDYTSKSIGCGIEYFYK